MISVKWNHEGTFRRFRLDTTQSQFSVFHTLRTKCESLVPAAAFDLAYIDDENDPILLACDSDVTEAIAMMPAGSPLRVLSIAAVEQKEKPAEEKETRNKGVPHPGTLCDGCDRQIVGHRYKCVTCEDYDLCADCESTSMHSNHALLRIVDPDATLVPWGTRLRRHRRHTVFGARHNPRYDHRAGHRNSAPFSEGLFRDFQTAWNARPTDPAQPINLKESVKKSMDFLTDMGTQVQQALANFERNEMLRQHFFGEEEDSADETRPLIRPESRHEHPSGIECDYEVRPPTDNENKEKTEEKTEEKKTEPTKEASTDVPSAPPQTAPSAPLYPTLIDLEQQHTTPQPALAPEPVPTAGFGQRRFRSSFNRPCENGFRTDRPLGFHPQSSGFLPHPTTAAERNLYQNKNGFGNSVGFGGSFRLARPAESRGGFGQGYGSGLRGGFEQSAYRHSYHGFGDEMERMADAMGEGLIKSRKEEKERRKAIKREEKEQRKEEHRQKREQAREERQEQGEDWGKEWREEVQKRNEEEKARMYDEVVKRYREQAQQANKEREVHSRAAEEGQQMMQLAHQAEAAAAALAQQASALKRNDEIKKHIETMRAGMEQVAKEPEQKEEAPTEQAGMSDSEDEWHVCADSKDAEMVSYLEAMGFSNEGGVLSALVAEVGCSDVDLLVTRCIEHAHNY